MMATHAWSRVASSPLTIVARALGPIILFVLLVLACSIAAAQGQPITKPLPEGRILQFKHVPVPIERGAPADIEDIAQAPNGDLWIGGTRGLFRFDGLSFTRFVATGDDQLRSDMIYSMDVTRAGDVWVGYYSGGASQIVGGVVRHHSVGLPKGPLKQFIEDQQGRIWAVSVKGVAYLQNGRWHGLRSGWQPEDGRPYRLLVAHDGTLWIATSRALLFVRPGEDVVHRTSLYVNEPWELMQAPDGRLWMSDLENGTRPIDPHPGTPPPPVKSASLKHPWVARRMLFDTAGNLWVILETQPGLILVPRPDKISTGTAISDRDIAHWYREPTDLTSNFAGPLLEDRQGIVWAGTSFGLDQFLPANFTARPEYGAVPVHGFRAVRAPDGLVAVADDSAVRVYALDGTLRTTLKTSGSPSDLCADGRGSLLLASDEGLVQVGEKKLLPVSLPDNLSSRLMLGCQFERGGNLWLLTRDDGLYVRRAGSWARAIPQDAIGTPWPRAMLIDGQDRLWLGADVNGANLLVGHKLIHFGPEQGFDIGQVHTAIAVPGGALFGGETGLAFYDGHRFHSIPQSIDPSLNVVTGLALDSRGDLWVSGTRGISVFPHQSLSALFAGKGGASLRQFNYRRELPGFSQLNCCANTIVPAAQGRLWVLTNAAVATVDPAHLRFRDLTVNVSIRSATSNNQSLQIAKPIRLQAGDPNLRIDYTADSLADADQIEFRYKLGGLDGGWVEAGNGREAYYSSLAPGHYRFVVQARRGGGAWSDRSAVLDITVPPTFLQTPLPKILAALVIIALIVTIFWLRWRIAMRLLEERIEGRANERERVAREFHDTLLQSFQGLILRMEAASQRLVHHADAYQTMRDVLERADHVVLEGRTKIEGLRGAKVSRDLATTILQSTADYRAILPDISLSAQTSGTPHFIAPLVHEELCQIATEALTNAYRHADAKHIAVEIAFKRFSLEIVISDDGKGFTVGAPLPADDQGHYGIVGMRERALRIGAMLAITSALEHGTTVTISYVTDSFVGRLFGGVARFERRSRLVTHQP